MYNTSNPAELYAGTTWELLPDNKFLKTGNAPLQVGGSNSVKLTKANLPTDKLQVESHSMTRGTMDITGQIALDDGALNHISGAFYKDKTINNDNNGSNAPYYSIIKFQASRTWAGSTSPASPYTTAMGSGTAITINPEHITIRAWKRLS